MLGWVSLAAATASCWKRLAKPGSPARSSRRIFTATVLASTSSRARHTAAIPPVSMSSSRTYRSASRRFGAGASMEGQSNAGPTAQRDDDQRERRGLLGSNLLVGGLLHIVFLEEPQTLDDQRVGPLGSLHDDRTIVGNGERDDPGRGVHALCRSEGVSFRPVWTLGSVIRVGSGQRSGPRDALRLDLSYYHLRGVVGRHTEQDQENQETDHHPAEEETRLVSPGDPRLLRRLHRRPTLLRTIWAMSVNSCIRNAAATARKLSPPATTPPPTCRSWGPRLAVPKAAPSHLAAR